MKLFISILILAMVGPSVAGQEIISMIKVKNQPIIIGELNGRKAYFLVDTGSSVSILNSKDAKRFKFGYRKINLKDYRLSGINWQHREVLIAYNVDFYLSGKKIPCSYMVFDISNIVESIKLNTGIKINGIIGSDLMKKHHFLIDYQAKEIRFKD